MRRPFRGSTVTLKIKAVRVGGKVYRYTRIPGLPAVRLPDLPLDDPRFLRAYAEAAGEVQTVAHAGSVAELCDAYSASERFKALSPDYLRVIRRHVEAIRAQGGDARARHLKRKHITADLAALAPNPAAARLKAWRLICAFGVETGRLAEDPSDGVKRRPIPKTAGHRPWTRTQIEAFRAAYPPETPARLAFEVLFWTAARIGDGVRLGDGMVGRDGVLSFRQAKTGGEVYVPWTCALPDYAASCAPDREHLHAALAARPARHMTFLATAYGRSRSVKGLGNIVSDAAHAIGIERSAHGLRKSRMTELAEAGATTHQLAAWSGHLTLAEVQHYTEAASRRSAVRGFDKRNAGSDKSAAKS